MKNTIKPYPHQIEKAEKCWDILRECGYVYLAGKPRSGKTLTSLLVAEKSEKISRVLILTKKAAIGGWEKFLFGFPLSHAYTVTNYEQVGKWDNKKNKAILKLNPEDYDLVIIDESHNLGTVGKPSGRYKVIKSLCYNMPHIHLSGTAIVESPNSIYHQMTISKFKPFKQINFYDFFRRYGKPYYIKAAGREIQQYDKIDPDKGLLEDINKFTVYMTQEDAGISSDVQAVDKVHYVDLDEDTKRAYNELQEDKVWMKVDGVNNLFCDTTMKLRVSLHMLESGVVKIDDDYILTGNTEKVDYIMKNFGDTEGLGIMCHFKGERMLLEKLFKKAAIYSSSAHAEGVDLSHLKHFVILSSDYSGSKFIQRRDRIVNIAGSNTTTVHHILVKKAISDQVYKKVSKKEDFNNSTYISDNI